MNVAYLTYQYASNPRGIPSGWVAEVIELGDDNTSPGANWVVTDLGTYQSYKDSQQAAYDAWAALNPEPGPQLTDEKYQVDTYNSKNQLISSTFYTTRIAQGSYSGKARDVVYTVDPATNSVTLSVETVYDANGVALSSKTETYYTSSSGALQFIVEQS